METAALVAPVTALEFLQDAFLLSGMQQFESDTSRDAQIWTENRQRT